MGRAVLGMCERYGGWPTLHRSARKYVEAFRVKPKMQLTFTCGVCETRNTKRFSRQSYEKGVVLVRCDGCEKMHLVSDQLGWFEDASWTVEGLLDEEGREMTRVNKS